LGLCLGTDTDLDLDAWPFSTITQRLVYELLQRDAQLKCPQRRRPIRNVTMAQCVKRWLWELVSKFPGILISVGLSTKERFWTQIDQVNNVSFNHPKKSFLVDKSIPVECILHMKLLQSVAYYVHENLTRSVNGLMSARIVR